MATAAASLPTYVSPAYHEMQPGWRRNRDVRRLAELLRVKPTGTSGTRLELVDKTALEYLPRFEAEEWDDYVARVGLTHPYDALEQTIAALVGLVFRTDPSPSQGASPQLTAWLDNFDGQGRTASIVLQEALDWAFTDGHSALLVEYPRLKGQAPSARQVEVEKIAPWVTTIRADQILNWRVGTRNGVRYLEQVTLLDYSDDPVGTFGSQRLKRYRVYRQTWVVNGTGFEVGLVTWELWREVAGAAEPLLEDSGALQGPTSIPLFPIYGGAQTGVLTSHPPLDGLAWANIDHTQVKSDRRFSLHKCAIPIPIFINRVRQAAAQPGAGAGDIVVSPSYGIDVGVGGDAKYMEPSGTALAQLRAELEDIERRMASQGAGMWRADSQPQTATFNVIQFGQQKSKLGRAIASLSGAANGAIAAMALYAGVEEPGTIAFRRDLTRFGLTDQQLEFVSRLEERGQLTLPTLLRILQSEAILPEDLDLEQEAEAVRRETELGRPDPLLDDGAPDPTAPNAGTGQGAGGGAE